MTSPRCDTVHLVVITSTRDILRQSCRIIEDREDYLTPRRKKVPDIDRGRTDVYIIQFAGVRRLGQRRRRVVGDRCTGFSCVSWPRRWFTKPTANLTTTWRRSNAPRVYMHDVYDVYIEVVYRNQLGLRGDVRKDAGHAPCSWPR